MENQFEHLVYSRNVIELVTVGREFCHWVENVSCQERNEFVGTAIKILPLLYLKASVIPKSEIILNDFLESFVTENDYDNIRNRIMNKMGKFDEYLEVFTADMQRSEVPLSSTVSENLADIYQDIRNFLLNYRTGVTEIMNDALVELIKEFETYWGQRLVNVLRALHMVYYSNDEIADDDDNGQGDDITDNIKTDNWIISQRQMEWQNGLFKGKKKN